jgi:hypothetical protein
MGNQRVSPTKQTSFGATSTSELLYFEVMSELTDKLKVANLVKKLRLKLSEIYEALWSSTVFTKAL